MSDIPIDELKKRDWLTIAEAARVLGVRDRRTAKKILRDGGVNARSFKGHDQTFLYDCERVKSCIIEVGASK